MMGREEEIAKLVEFRENLQNELEETERKNEEIDAACREATAELRDKIQALDEKMAEYKEEMKKITVSDHYERKSPKPPFPSEYIRESDLAYFEKWGDYKATNAVERMEKEHREKYYPQVAAIGASRAGSRFEKKKPTPKPVIVAILIGIIALVLVAESIFAKLIELVENPFLMVLIIFFAIVIFVPMWLKRLLKRQQKNYEEVELPGFLKQYSAWREKCFEHQKEEEEIRKKLESERAALVNEFRIKHFDPALAEREALEKERKRIVAEFEEKKIEMPDEFSSDILRLTVPFSTGGIEIIGELIYALRQEFAFSVGDAVDWYKAEVERRNREWEEEQRRREEQEEERARRRREAEKEQEREAEKRCNCCKKRWDCSLRYKYRVEALMCTEFQLR